MQQSAHAPTPETAPETGAIDPLGASSISERIDMITSLTSDLSDLLQAETALIVAHQSGKLRDTEEKKSRLSGLYAREMRAIRERPELLKGATEAQKEDLRASATEFDHIVREHARSLSRSRAVTEGLVRAIGEEVTQRHQPVTGYLRPGARPTAQMLQPAPPALSLDQTI